MNIVLQLRHSYRLSSYFPNLQDLKGATETGLPVQELSPELLPDIKLPDRKQVTRIMTQDVIDSYLLHKEHEEAADSSMKTYRKRLRRFARQFPVLPLETKTTIKYLRQFTGRTRRHKLNHQDTLNALYEHALHFFDVPKNPLKNLKRPKVVGLPIRTLSLEEVYRVNLVIYTITEEVVWQLTVGHGWRQVEVRRITAGDVRSISNGTILCRGKEREEPAPLLPETQELLQQLAATLPDDENVIRSTRIRAGKTQPLGEDGMAQLIQRLFNRAGIQYQGHDLRRTFCTLVREASGDEFLAMRLARDKIQGVNDRYINTDAVKLGESLNKYSPIRLIRNMQTGESLVEAGESRTPRPREATQNILQA